MSDVVEIEGGDPFDQGPMGFDIGAGGATRGEAKAAG
jgi:hypothetical protein